MRPLQHKCPSLRGDKDDKERATDHQVPEVPPQYGVPLPPDVPYVTQGRPDKGLLRVTQRAQAIITQGIGVYARPLLQPTQITTRTAQGDPPTSITPQQLPAYPDPATPTSSTSLTHPAPSNTPHSRLCLRVHHLVRGRPPRGTPHRGHHLWGVLPRRTTHPGGRHHRHTTTHNDPAPQHLGSRERHGRHLPHQAPRGPAHPQGTQIRPLHTSVGAMDGLQRHASPGRPTHRKTGVPPLHVRQ